MAEADVFRECSHCHKRVGTGPVCGHCDRRIDVLPDGSPAPAFETTPPKSTEDARATLCIMLGLALAGIGVYFLLLSPGVGGAYGVVNMQRLYIGQIASISGAIFLAVGMRPRYCSS